MDTIDVDQAIAALESDVRAGAPPEIAPTAPADKTPTEPEKPAEGAEAGDWKREVEELRSKHDSQAKLVDTLQTVLYGLTQQPERREEPAPRREEPGVSMAELQGAFEKDPINTLLWIQQQSEQRVVAAMDARLQQMQDPRALRRTLDPVLREAMGPVVDQYFKVGRRTALDDWSEKNPAMAHARAAIAKVLDEYPEIAHRSDAIEVAYKLAKGSGHLDASPAHGRFLGRGGGASRAQDMLSDEERNVARRFGMSEGDYLKFKQQRSEEA